MTIKMRRRSRAMTREQMTEWWAERLRRAAEEWAIHLHDKPVDNRDSACKQRWVELGRAALEYARFKGVVPWVSDPW